MRPIGVVFLSLTLIATLAACGGGGGAPEPGADARPSSALAQICSADNLLKVDALSETRVGTLADERNWIQAYLDERYLWYRDMPSVQASDPAYNIATGTRWQNFAQSVSNFFDDLLNPKIAESGNKVDAFSFMTSTTQWQQFTQGSERGFGWLLSEQGSGPDRRIWVSYVYPTYHSQLAKANGIERGDEILAINEHRVNKPESAQSVEALLLPRPNDSGTRRFLVKKKDGEELTKWLTPSTDELPQVEYKLVPVDGKNWAYLLFNSHVASAQALLREALVEFKNERVEHLVLDLRYNGGGYLALASALSYAVAGPEKTSGKTFEMLRYNDKRTAENERLPFFSRDRDGQPVESLNLSKIYVLTSEQTCSASESIINGLRGIDVEVVQVGGTTCGKPYGFVPQDNCGITYAAMEFEGVNHKGLGGYGDGLIPQCAVTDDLAFELGDPREGMLATAIAHSAGVACVSVSASRALGMGTMRSLGGDAKKLIRQDWQKAKFLSPVQQGF